MKRTISITRRLISTVLLVEVLSALGLVVAITVHEYHVQLTAFDAALQGTAQSLMGAVQDAEDENDNVMLDLRGVEIRKHAIFRVGEPSGRVLGSTGSLPVELKSSSQPMIQEASVEGKRYRFYSFHGIRIIDPGAPGGGIRHSVTVIYGMPVGHVWHEVVEAIRFFVIATILLIGSTALLMAWLVKKELQPIRELAQEAERINATTWTFSSPDSAREVEELRPLITALERALERLQRSFELQRRFTNDAAHELKTDVAIVKSSLQLLSMRKRTVEEYSRGLTVSVEDLTRLETTVQKMLTLARLEQPVESKLGSCCLRDVVEDAVYQSKAFAELKEIEVSMELTTDAKVTLDSADALLLCSNLLVNALQHSPEQSRVQISLHRKDDGVQLTINDQGEGVAEEDLPNLFQPFYRGDPSRSRKKGGTGLGLSICKAICNRANGSIRIMNRPTGGTCVTVDLPACGLISTAVSVSIKA